MSERILAKGYLADAKKRFREKDLEASGLLVAIRMALNPYEDDLTKIDIEKVVVMANRLRDCIDELKSLKTKIERLEAEIDG
jgi:ubiquinone biosynthesis protein UbiJ